MQVVQIYLSFPGACRGDFGELPEYLKKALTRIFHRVSTAATQAGMPDALRLFGRLDILSNMPALPSLRAPCIHARLRRMSGRNPVKYPG